VDEIGRQAHTLGEVVGLALREVGSCPMELNLRPVSLVKRQRVARQKPFIVLAGVCFLMILAAWWLYFDHAAKVTSEMTSKVEERLEPLKAMDNKMKAVETEKKQQDQLAAPLLAAVNDRSYWAELINDINSRLPKDYIWVVSLAPQAVKPGSSSSSNAKNAPAKPAGPSLLLQGLYLENPRNASVVDDFIAKLGESPLYEVKKDELKRSVPNDTEWAYEYSVPLILKTSTVR
jgi:Tfp pilus assembly protein PilN